MDKKDQESLPEKKTKKRFLPSRFKRDKAAKTPPEASVPRITDETVYEHREEVLGDARKYIYPLRHSRHTIVIITISLLTALIIGFSTYLLLSLYRFQSTSAFIYQVTKVLPLPIGRIGGTYIAYENYLFELRHYIHYYEQQEQVDFATDAGKAQLADQRKKSLDKVVDYAYIERIAKEKGITVTSEEVDARIETLKNLSRLGNEGNVIEDVLQDYWGWNLADFRRSIKQQILISKVMESFDTNARSRADAALAALQQGQDFAAVAKQYSDDPATRDQGGELGFLVSKTDKNIPPQTVDALYKLQPGQISGIVNIDYGLEIVKNLGEQDGKIKAARIFIAYQDLSNFLNDYKAKNPARIFIHVQE